jgi:hypothetical protein
MIAKRNPFSDQRVVLSYGVMPVLVAGITTCFGTHAKKTSAGTSPAMTTF